ncbi:MAG: tetratricopeptide repeat protein, partial [Alphaproteobacteria bacterium]|nr:tetratricopeptide repeat protein [Alphaproteobacteria bacterium]
MRFGLRVAAVGLSVVLGACAGSTPRAPGEQAIASEDSEASEFGNYLSARFAASQHNLKDAAGYYRASLAADPTNPQLLALSFFFSTSSGDIDDAAKLAERLIAANPDDRAARLTLAVVALKKHDYAAARQHMATSAKGPFTSLTVALIDAWAAIGAGDKAGAIADMTTMKEQGGADALAVFHLALLAEYGGDAAVAEQSYKTLLAAGGASPRVV